MAETKDESEVGLGVRGFKIIVFFTFVSACANMNNNIIN